jgi:hypothetical protein
VASVNANGTTIASAETSKATGNSGASTNTITISWTAVAGATSYKVYGRTTGAEQLIGTVTAPTTSFTDTGSVTPSGSLPSNPSGNQVLLQCWNLQNNAPLVVQNSGGSTIAEITGSGSFVSINVVTAGLIGQVASAMLGSVYGNAAQGLGVQASAQSNSSGYSIGFFRLSTTTAGRAVAAIDTNWANSTDASRAGRLQLWACDASGTDKEILRGESTGSAAALGFFGAPAVTKPTVSGSRGGNAALASLITALANVGLITDSSTA